MVRDGYDGKCVISKTTVEHKFNDHTLFEKAMVLAFTDKGAKIPNYTAFAPTTEQALQAFREITGIIDNLALEQGVYVFSSDSIHADSLIFIVAEDQSGYDSAGALSIASMYCTHKQLREVFDFLTEKWE